MNYIKVFRDSKDLSVSVVNSYTEYHLIHVFFDNFCQGGKYNADIASHWVELRREGNFTDQNNL